MAGAYQTSLVSYLIQRDLFPALIKVRLLDSPSHPVTKYQSITESEEDHVIQRAVLLLSLLANYDRFEMRNPYRVRLEDFANAQVMQRIVLTIATLLRQARDEYVDVQPDVPEAWSMGSRLSLLGIKPRTHSSPKAANRISSKEGDFVHL